MKDDTSSSLESTPKLIKSSILESIGNTPMVRINRVGVEEGVKCEILVKCEFLNPGGSIKDRIAKKMVETAEQDGILRQDVPCTIVEPTSGNTGIGLALASAVKGYKCIIALPEKMSQEKVNTLKALGAEIHRTPTEVASSDPTSNIGVAKLIVKKGGPNTFMPDQYNNLDNPLAHYEQTAWEIWTACRGKVDVIVIGAGTGGTITGVARRLKELNPAIIIVGVDPIGSILGGKDGMFGVAYQVEGIGYDFFPTVMDPSLVDHWVKVGDKESFKMSRRLIRSEGLLCGGSSGSIMCGAISIAKQLMLKENQRMVVLLPDSIRNYMSKFLNDDWMLINGFLDPKEIMDNEIHSGEEEEEGGRLVVVGNLELSQVPIIGIEATGADLLTLSRANHDASLIAIHDNGKIVGNVKMEKFSIKFIRQGPNVLSQNVRRIMEKEQMVLGSDTPVKIAATFAATGFPIFIVDGEVTENYVLSLSPNNFLPSTASVTTNNQADVRE